MKKIILLLAVSSLIAALQAQNYAVSLIPDSLKENAHSVLRVYTTSMVLSSVNSGSEEIKKVYTILDKDGEEDAYLVVHYDDNSSVNTPEITLYDAAGKKIRKAKDSEIIDIPAYSGSLFADNRVKYYKPNYGGYPYTVEYLYSRSSKNMISYGAWTPINTYDQSVQFAQYSITYPADVKVNKRECKMPLSKAGSAGSDKIESWEFSGLKAVEDEVLSSNLTKVVPILFLMPSELHWKNNIGKANDWREYGEWAFDLYDGRSEISEAEKIKVSALIKDMPDTLQRIKALYSYMQERTRYVSVSVGIGGWQPFDAKTVYETGYGDCKALSNYMHALLNYIGVKSHPTLVSAGVSIEPIYKDFPNFSQFNHVILSVPQTKDTIWLECTNQLIPFGFLGDFTDDRDVLLLTDKGGEFAHTKKYTASDNTLTTTSQISIDSVGTAQCDLHAEYKALRYDDITALFYSNVDEQKKWLYKALGFPSPQLTSFSIDQTKSIIPVAVVNQIVTSRNYCSFSGNYMVMPLNVVNPASAIPKMLKPRLSDISISRSYTDVDTIIYQIPNSFKIESLPTGKTIESKFGRYSYSVVANGAEIKYIRQFVRNQGLYKPEEYKDLYNFFLAVAKADGAKAMLIKKM